MSEDVTREAPAEPVAEDSAAPVEAVTETTAETTTETAPKPKAEGDDGDPAAKRIARLTAKLAAESAARRDLEARFAAAQRGTPAQPAADLPPEAKAAAEAHAERLYQQRVVQERVDNFHSAGKAAFSDWQDRCQSLMDMGGDAQFAELLVDMPDGAKVAAALADDPEAMERIAGLKSERARAIALGKYSAAMEATPAARPVSKAPAPIVPLRGGPVKTVFNEQTATAAQLVEHYSKQERARRGL